MSCNSCAKGFSILRQEKGCPGCGFSFCSKCLNNKMFLPKLNSEAKVCAKCKKLTVQKNDEVKMVLPPDAFFKREAVHIDKPDTSMSSSASSEPKNIDDQIHARLRKLKEDNVVKKTSEEEITERLQGLKGAVQPPSEADISERLARLKGTPVIISKPSLPVQDLRSEQEQADDLLKQYVTQTQIDTKYKDEFDTLISDMEARMLKLKGSKSLVPSSEGPGTSDNTGIGNQPEHVIDSDNEEESVKKIIEKIRAEASIEEDEISPSTNDELPFCEICNEDATLRCLGCRYLFCKRCYLDHKDDDDGCNRYEAYKPPKGKVY